VAELTQKERTRARILHEAAGAIREQGVEGVGVASLMKRAGLTHGGFYAHFANRDDLVANAVEHMFRESADLLNRHLDHEDPAEGLRATIDYYLSEEARKRPSAGCPLPSLSGEAARMPDAARQRFSQGIVSFRRALERAISATGVENAAEVAASVLAELVGSMALARALDDVTSASMLDASRKQLKRRLALSD